MTLFLMFVVLFVLLVAGAPVAVALGLSSLFFIANSGMPNLVVLHNMVNGINSFPLIAVPFFILAGHLMNTSGITNKIFAFARAAVGWMHGGLGHVNVGASVIFAGMSGAAVADAGGLGNIEIKAMRDAGYDTSASRLHHPPSDRSFRLPCRWSSTASSPIPRSANCSRQALSPASSWPCH